MSPDIVTGMFEIGGMFFISLSIIQLYKDKVVRGVSWMHVAFFSTWGFWNLFYYPHLEQWWALAGGIGIVSANTTWLMQLLYYLYKEAHEPLPGHILGMPWLDCGDND